MPGIPVPGGKMQSNGIGHILDTEDALGVINTE